MVYSRTVQFACCCSFEMEQQEVESTNSMNKVNRSLILKIRKNLKVLIGNILPLHVCDYFMNAHRPEDVSEIFDNSDYKFQISKFLRISTAEFTTTPVLCLPVSQTFPNFGSSLMFKEKLSVYDY